MRSWPRSSFGILETSRDRSRWLRGQQLPNIITTQSNAHHQCQPNAKPIINASPMHSLIGDSPISSLLPVTRQSLLTACPSPGLIFSSAQRTTYQRCLRMLHRCPQGLSIAPSLKDRPFITGYDKDSIAGVTPAGIQHTSITTVLSFPYEFPDRCFPNFQVQCAPVSKHTQANYPAVPVMKALWQQQTSM